MCPPSTFSVTSGCAFVSMTLVGLTRYLWYFPPEASPSSIACCQQPSTYLKQGMQLRPPALTTPGDPLPSPVPCRLG